jgi:hypothetical protein
MAIQQQMHQNNHIIMHIGPIRQRHTFVSKLSILIKQNLYFNTLSSNDYNYAIKHHLISKITSLKIYGIN